MSGLAPAALLVHIDSAATRPGVLRAAQQAAGAAVNEAPAPEHAELFAAALDEARRQVPEQAPLLTLQHWIDQVGPPEPARALRAALAETFFATPPEAVFYPEAPGCLRRWARTGIGLYGLTSGPRRLARMALKHAPGGALDTLLAGLFDARVGHRRDPDSYIRLAIAMGVPTVEVLLLAGEEATLDAAAAAGMRTCQVLRPGTGTASRRHPSAKDLAEAARGFGLPAG